MKLHRALYHTVSEESPDNPTHTLLLPYRNSYLSTTGNSSGEKNRVPHWLDRGSIFIQDSGSHLTKGFAQCPSKAFQNWFFLLNVGSKNSNFPNSLVTKRVKTKKVFLGFIPREKWRILFNTIFLNKNMCWRNLLMNHESAIIDNVSTNWQLFQLALVVQK